jgi:hypothetical protein
LWFVKTEIFSDGLNSPLAILILSFGCIKNMTKSTSLLYLCVIRMKLTGFLFCVITEKNEKKYVITVYISANRAGFHNTAL